MQTVKLFKVTCTKAFQMYEQGTRFSLKAWGKDTERIQGYDDGGKDYVLPEGYTVAEMVSGGLAIYDSDDNYCQLYTVKNTPMIYGKQGQEIYLKKAN